MPDTQAVSVRGKVEAEAGLQPPSQAPPRAAGQMSEPKPQLEQDQSAGPARSLQVLSLARLYGGTLDEEKAAAQVCSR